MRQVAIFYSFVVAAASVFLSPLDALAENRLSGFVFATDSCQLHPPQPGEACLTALSPIRGTIALRRRGSATRQIIELNDRGTFTKKVPQGRYRVKLVDARSGTKRLVPADYRLSPSAVTVASTSAKSQTSVSVHIAVSHRTRPQTPFAGVSDDCNVK